MSYSSQPTEPLRLWIQRCCTDALLLLLLLLLSSLVGCVAVVATKSTQTFSFTSLISLNFQSFQLLSETFVYQLVHMPPGHHSFLCSVLLFIYSVMIFVFYTCVYQILNHIFYESDICQ